MIIIILGLSLYGYNYDRFRIRRAAASVVFVFFFYLPFRQTAFISSNRQLVHIIQVLETQCIVVIITHGREN